MHHLSSFDTIQGNDKSEVNKNIVGWVAVFLATQRTFAKDVGLTIELLAQPTHYLLLITPVKRHFIFVR